VLTGSANEKVPCFNLLNLESLVSWKTILSSGRPEVIHSLLAYIVGIGFDSNKHGELWLGKPVVLIVCKTCVCQTSADLLWLWEVFVCFKMEDEQFLGCSCGIYDSSWLYHSLSTCFIPEILINFSSWNYLELLIFISCSFVFASLDAASHTLRYPDQEAKVKCDHPISVSEDRLPSYRQWVNFKRSLCIVYCAAFQWLVNLFWYNLLYLIYVDYTFYFNVFYSALCWHSKL